MVDSTSPRKIIDRKIRPFVETALEDTRAVLIIGPRQAGKSTLARQFSGAARPYITLDDAGDRRKWTRSTLPTGAPRGTEPLVHMLTELPTTWAGQTA